MGMKVVFDPKDFNNLGIFKWIGKPKKHARNQLD